MLTAQAGDAQESGDDLRKAVVFHASFDEDVKADIAGGQAMLDARSNLPTEPGRFIFDKGFNEQVFRIAKDRGISGGALEAVDVLPNNGRVFFPAQGNPGLPRVAETPARRTGIRRVGRSPRFRNLRRVVWSG